MYLVYKAQIMTIFVWTEANVKNLKYISFYQKNKTFSKLGTKFTFLFTFDDMNTEVCKF